MLRPLVFVFLLLTCQAPAKAASDATCRTYANQAVAAVQIAKASTCPQIGPAGRWSLRQDDHYRWCRGVRDSTVINEMLARGRQVEICQRDDGTCKRYASRAREQIATLSKLRCVANPPERWDANADHYKWCRVNLSTSANVRRQTELRDAAIGKCSMCERYAGGAVASATRLFARGCGGIAYGEGRWSTNYEQHRAYCLRAKPSTVQFEDNERDKSHLQCDVMLKNPVSAPVAPAPPAVTRACNVVATLTVTGCTNKDGTPADYFTTTHNVNGCGATEEEAESSAKLTYNGDLGDGPEKCQYEPEFERRPCACTLPAVSARRRPSSAGNVWTSFAANSRGAFGIAANRASFAESSADALAQCGGVGCRVFSTTTEKCTAFAESRTDGYWYATGGGDDRTTAERNALRYCNGTSAPAGSCKIARWTCR